MKATVLAAALVTAAFFTSAIAQVKPHAKHQRQRTVQGVKSGELTSAETKNIRNDQKEIRKEVKAAKADGNVTKEERKDIRKDQRQASRNIYRKKHNNRDRN